MYWRAEICCSALNVYFYKQKKYFLKIFWEVCKFYIVWIENKREDVTQHAIAEKSVISFSGEKNISDS